MRRTLLVLAWASCLLAACAAPGGSAPRKISPGANKPAPARQLTVYCFHGQFRCFTCEKMEEYTGKTLREHYSDDLRSGKVLFRVVNLGEAENRHFVAEYGLDSWTVVLSLRKDGREVGFRNLVFLNDYVRDEPGFTNRLFREIESFLAAEGDGDVR